MLPQETVVEITEQLGVLFSGRRRAFERILAGVMEQLPGSSLHGSRAVLAFAESGRDELILRSASGWDAIKHVLSSLGIVPTEAAAVEIGDLIAATVEEHRAELVERVEEEARLTRQTIRFTDEIDTVAADLERKYRSEARLLMGNLRRTGVQVDDGRPVFNFHGSVGVVQTGVGASANVTQAIGSSRGDVLEVLDKLDQLIAANPSDSDPSLQETNELVAELRREVQRALPNGGRVVGLLVGLSQAVQTAAALKPAYSWIQAVLLPLGVVLP
ncbi:MAG TPA: hypothetical protein VFN22_07235 [Gemmatimonadales bacterium]|nr:hypothetical protein [Gemmatimonadales bacterium]